VVEGPDGKQYIMIGAGRFLGKNMCRFCWSVSLCPAIAS
jgi:hypothetical protein